MPNNVSWGYTSTNTTNYRVNEQYLDELLRTVSESPEYRERVQGAPPATPKKAFEKPVSAGEAFKILPIGAAFYLRGPNVDEPRWYKRRVKISETHYDTDGESTRREGTRFSRTTELLRTI